jgi:hypothetical protein
MASRKQIQDAFVVELKNTPQYQIVLDIKQTILDEIALPNIQSTIIYKFDVRQTEEEQNIIKMCMIVEFGFSTNNISEVSVIFDMINFLQ